MTQGTAPDDGQRVQVWTPGKAFEETWSRREFAQGARSGLAGAAALVLLTRVVGGARRRGR